MTFASHLRVGTAIAALLCASAAQADVTADQVWQLWKSQAADMGQTITVASEAMEGDTLVVKEAKIEAGGANSTSVGILSELRLQEMGDGTVKVTLPSETPFDTTTTPANGPAVQMKMTLRQTDLSILVGGTPEAMTFDYSGPEVSMSFDGAETAGGVAPAKALFTIRNLALKTTVAKGETTNTDGNFSAESISYAVAGADPEGTGTFNMTGVLNGLAGTTKSATVGKVDMENIAAALQAGFAMDGAFTYADGSSKIEATGPDGTFTADTAGGAGKLSLKMSKDGIAYGGEATDSKLMLAGQSMPFPIEATVAQSVFSLAMPVTKSDAAQPTSLVVKLIDLGVSDQLWGMFDPQAKLPHDPASLVIDLSGAIRPLTDIFNPEQAAATQPPFEISQAKINQLQIKAMGAELTGVGDVSFDNATGTPKPLGAIDLNLTGANALMDKLVEMGMVPEDQVMGARMMMGMFAIPSGDDAMTSKIEFKEDGGIYANGQRIQ